MAETLRLSRAQLEVICHGDRRAIDTFEKLLRDSATFTEGDLVAIEARLSAVEVQSGTTFSWGDHALVGYLTDAPSDGITYGRSSGSWVAAFSLTDVRFDDDEKLYFGTGNDTELYYDGVDFHIAALSGEIKTDGADINVDTDGVVYTNRICAV